MVTPDNSTFAKSVSQYASERDLFLFSGPIEDSSSDEMIDLVCDRPSSNQSVSLLLTTGGGDPHAAYRMVRCLQQRYEDIRLLIVGRCKSAGTLVALGANSLAFGRWGELGPLDTQMSKPDELIFNNSGLDILQALAMVTENGWGSFARYVIDLVGAGLSTRVASEIAGNLASGLMEPIAAQVDPMRLSEATRAIKVATAYGERVGRGNSKSGALQTLVNEYPAHPFVIDKLEAEDLFYSVSNLNKLEESIAHAIEDKRRVLRYPATPALVMDLGDEYSTDTEEGESHDDGTGTTKATGEGRTKDSAEPEEPGRNASVPTATTQDGDTPG